MKRHKLLPPLVACVMACALALIGAPAASSAPTDNGIQKLVFFGQNRVISYADLNTQPGGYGDTYFRTTAMSKTINGPIIGVMYAQAEVVSGASAGTVFG